MEKRNEIQFDRLLQFADFLASQTDPPGRPLYRIPAYDVLIWVFDFLPYFSDEWFFEYGAGKPIFNGHELGIDTISSVAIYFGVDEPSHFEEIFAVNRHLEKRRHTCKEVAENIVRFVNKKKKENQQ